MHEVTLPKAGNTMEDGTVVQWRKAEGDTVEAGEVLLEVETDKATVEIESPAEGTLLKILAEAGQTVEVHALIAVIGQPGEDVSAAVEAASGGGDAPAETGSEEERPVPVEADGPAGEVVPVVMPKAGNSMEEGTITGWKVAEGDAIEVGDIIFEVETDKANIEVEATDAGRLARIVAEAGETVEVLRPVAYLAEDPADVDAYIAAHGDETADSAGGASVAAAEPAGDAPALAPQKSAPAASSATTDSGRVKASPAARKMAAERGVNLAAVGAGRGPGGRILTDDVASAPAAAAGAAPMPAVQATGEVVRRKLSPMRKAIARNLLASKKNIPHFYMRVSFDAAPLQDFYRGEKAKYPCTLNDVILAAVARTMQEFPAFRQQLHGDELIERPTSNVGIAVGLDDGLVVPVVVGAEGMTLEQLGGQTRRLVEAARAGRIENMGEGNMTISNLGMFGIEEFSAIINPPEAAILAVGGIREEVIVSGGTMRPGKVMTMTLSCDHRVVDGLLAAKYVNRLKEILEYPAVLA